MKTEQLIDCEGITLDSSKPFAFSCCDCGLTHHMVIVSEDGKPVGFAVKRMESMQEVTLQVAEDTCQPARTMTVQVSAAPQPPASVQPLAVGETPLNWREVAVWWEQGAKDWQDLKEIIPRMLKRASPPPPGRVVPLTEIGPMGMTCQHSNRSDCALFENKK